MDMITVNEMVTAPGAVIASIGIGERPNTQEDALIIRFEDGSGVCVWDDGHQCCEHRHMSTDDCLTLFQGATVTGIELREVSAPDDGQDQFHDQAFLIVTTTLGSFTVVNHNEHNGYYGGFSVRCERLAKTAPWFHFRQNNSGGGFTKDAARGLGVDVWIQAEDAACANLRAESLGIYFDGCVKGYDCSCCGDRWHEAYDDEGEPRPEIDLKYDFGWHNEVYLHPLPPGEIIVLITERNVGKYAAQGVISITK